MIALSPGLQFFKLIRNRLPQSNEQRNVFFQVTSNQLMAIDDDLFSSRHLTCSNEGFEYVPAVQHTPRLPPNSRKSPPQT